MGQGLLLDVPVFTVLKPTVHHSKNNGMGYHWKREFHGLDVVSVQTDQLAKPVHTIQYLCIQGKFNIPIAKC